MVGVVVVVVAAAAVVVVVVVVGAIVWQFLQDPHRLAVLAGPRVFQSGQGEVEVIHPASRLCCWCCCGGGGCSHSLAVLGSSRATKVRWKSFIQLGICHCCGGGGGCHHLEVPASSKKAEM